jgi:hypothetical protein
VEEELMARLESWETMISRMAQIAATEGEPAAIKYARRWHAARRRREDAEDSTVDPDESSEEEEPTRRDRFASYVNDWSEGEEEAFHEGMRLWRQRDAKAAQDALTGESDDDAGDEDAEDLLGL